MRINDQQSEFLTRLAQAIFDKKGFNILVLDARHCSSLADFFIIAEGRSDRHVRAICDALLTSQNEPKSSPIAVEGKQFGEWIAVDYGELIIHLFSPGWREKYALEELWRECHIVDVPLTVREGLKDVGNGEVYE